MLTVVVTFLTLIEGEVTATTTEYPCSCPLTATLFAQRVADHDFGPHTLILDVQIKETTP